MGAGEGFAVEEFVFDQAVDGFDVALPGVAFGRDEAVVGAEGADGGGEALVVLVDLDSLPLSVCQTRVVRLTPWAARWAESCVARRVA
ncbi:hypothetical protein NXS98_02475 [Fontisphaera persica]|uniref:hypothetical protein n=1 Tax=Fontisphaera persica TaxID=2974023 RepID=UPI0024BFF6BC|nr:hypothetical protein [Fontisphaera persica]WCJ58279.1 hypothetical protein NXS98_11140 [Fontisphaera persica]WCJ60012.1 hypothetical protein NXS98_02475 [Fontisphaera persica]